MRHKFMKALLLLIMFMQVFSPLTGFAETTDSENNETEETTESSIPSLSESVDKTLEGLQDKANPPIMIESDGGQEAIETESKEPDTEDSETIEVAPTAGNIMPMGIGTRATNFIDVNAAGLDMRSGNPTSGISIADSPKNPWTKVFTVYHNNISPSYLPPIGVYIRVQYRSERYLYYRTGSDYVNEPNIFTNKYVQIEVEIPAHLRDPSYEFLYNASNESATYPNQNIWEFNPRAGFSGSFRVNNASGAITPNRPITLSADGTSTSGTASFSLTNASIASAQVYFFTDRNQAAANPPNLSQAQQIANCTVSGNTLSFSGRTLTRGATYYYRYFIQTNYSEIKIFSAFNDGYRITMPDITLTEAQMAVGITSDGLGVSARVPYVLLSPFEGTATSIAQNRSNIRFYPSLANAIGNVAAGRTEVIPDINLNSKLIYKDKITGLEAGKTYWYTLGGGTNYSAIWRLTTANDSRKITMPKLTLSAPVITPVGTSGTINAAVTSTLVGTNANYPANTSKVYIFDNEQHANNKNTAARVLEGNLTHNGTQMKIDNLAGLTPGKKYWARFYVGSNYTAINQWSDVVPFSIPYTVNEQYYDLSGTYIKNETVTISDGSTYQPSEADFSHNSKDYIYYGWLDATETPGVDTPKHTPFTANNNTTVKLIYLDRATALMLRSVPKLDFGTVETSDVTQDYSLDTSKYGGSSADLAVEFLDRRLTSTGWSLKAQLSDLEMNHSSTEKLTNATLSMSRKLQLLDASSNWSDTLPAGFNDYGGGDITLYAGGSEVDVFSSGTASPTDCNGIWRNLIDFNSVKLNVQGGTALKGATYSGKVTWKLDNTP